MQPQQPQLVEITHINQDQRIDNYLITRLKGVPKSHVYRIIRKGEVRVNKKRIKPEYRLQAGDIVRIPPLRLATPPSTTPPPKMQERLEQCILYEDSNLIVINKPSGVAVHGGSGISFGVIEALRQSRPQEKFLELVHRLDRDTSGCLLLAKKPGVLKELHELMRNNQIEKIYLALVQGYWPRHLHQVDVSLKKYQLQSGERMVSVNTEGKTALTEFRVIERFTTTTLMEAKLHTGRTHQIRVHALHAKHPVVGDDKYGDKDFNKELRKFGCKRLFLHATKLQFVLPSTGQTITVQADLDAELQACLARLRE